MENSVLNIWIIKNVGVFQKTNNSIKLCKFDEGYYKTVNLIRDNV